MTVNVKDLSILLGEYNSLSNKPRLTKTDEQRCAYLQTAIAAVKSGVSLADVDQELHNERARANGFPMTSFKKNSFLSKEQEAEARGWQALVEHRDMVEGAPMLTHIGTYTGLGYFIPNGFYQTLFAAMGAHDVLFDDDACTVIRTTNGRPLPVPVAGDITNVASVVSEAGSQTSVDIDSTGHAVLGAYSYSTPRFVVSNESFQDLDASFTAIGLFRQFAADRLARGIGKHLVTGDGVGKTLGLVPALAALVAPVTAVGSSGNTGGSETGVNSLGSADFATAYQTIDAAYLASPKCAWLMNQRTLATVSSIVDKYGNILQLVQYLDGDPYIFGVPVKICPSMDNIGVSNTPVILGDLSYWATRLVVDDQSGIAVFTEAPGLVENGNVGLRCFARAHGALLYSDTSSPSPFIAIRNHS